MGNGGRAGKRWARAASQWTQEPLATHRLARTDEGSQMCWAGTGMSRHDQRVATHAGALNGMDKATLTVQKVAVAGVRVLETGTV